MFFFGHLIDLDRCSIIEVPSFAPTPPSHLTTLLPFPIFRFQSSTSLSTLFSEFPFSTHEFHVSFDPIALSSIRDRPLPSSRRRDKLSRRRRTRLSGSFEYLSFSWAFTLYLIWIITDFALGKSLNERQVFKRMKYIIILQFLWDNNIWRFLN